MVESKMEQVAAMNNFEKLLGRNGELVELRKEQVLDGAMSIIQKHYADKQNKMEAIAQLFGKKLGEEFSVKDKYKTEWHCKFTKRGLLYLDKTFFDWQESGDYLLQFLLIGEAVIK
jgi:hypothetical protein